MGFHTHLDTSLQHLFVRISEKHRLFQVSRFQRHILDSLSFQTVLELQSYDISQYQSFQTFLWLEVRKRSMLHVTISNTKVFTFQKLGFGQNPLNGNNFLILFLYETVKENKRCVSAESLPQHNMKHLVLLHVVLRQTWLCNVRFWRGLLGSCGRLEFQDSSFSFT